MEDTIPGTHGIYNLWIYLKLYYYVFHQFKQAKFAYAS